MTTNKPEPIAWGIDPRKMSEADLLPCPACGNQAGKATKRAAKGLPFVGLWKVSCQRPECPLAMIYFHPVEWNQLPRIKQSEYDALQAECEKLVSALRRISYRASGYECRQTPTSDLQRAFADLMRQADDALYGFYNDGLPKQRFCEYAGCCEPVVEGALCTAHLEDWREQQAIDAAIAEGDEVQGGGSNARE